MPLPRGVAWTWPSPLEVEGENPLLSHVHPAKQAVRGKAEAPGEGLRCDHHASTDDGRAAKLKEILKKLDQAFEKVETQKAASGQTYGELLKAGKLP